MYEDSETTMTRTFGYTSKLADQIHVGYVRFYQNRGRRPPLVTSCTIEDPVGFADWAARHIEAGDGECRIGYHHDEE